MRNIWHAGLTLIVCLPFALKAQSLKPLSTEFVDCVTNEGGAFVASRKQQTPVLESKIGNRAYGEVSAEASGSGGCPVSTIVYVAEGNGSFRPALQQGVERLSDGSVYDGSGVAYMSWSPSGRKLLVVLFQWTWGTDGGGNYKYFLIEPGHNAAELIFPERAIWKQFKRPCAALIDFNRWVDDERIQLEVRPFVSTNEEGEPDETSSCVKEAAMRSFDVVRNKISQSLPTGKQRRR